MVRGTYLFNVTKKIFKKKKGNFARFWEKTDFGNAIAWGKTQALSFLATVPHFSAPHAKDTFPFGLGHRYIFSHFHKNHSSLEIAEKTGLVSFQ